MQRGRDRRPSSVPSDAPQRRSLSRNLLRRHTLPPAVEGRLGGRVGVPLTLLDTETGRRAPAAATVTVQLRGSGRWVAESSGLACGLLPDTDGGSLLPAARGMRCCFSPFFLFFLFFYFLFFLLFHAVLFFIFLEKRTKIYELYPSPGTLSREPCIPD